MTEAFDLESALAFGHISPDLFSRYKKLHEIAVKTAAMGLTLSDQERIAIKSYEKIAPLLPELLTQYLEAQQPQQKTKQKPTSQVA